MWKRLIPAVILVAFSALLVKVMVFKDIPMIRVGQLMLNFGGTDAGHAPNFVPFKTILPYLFGYKGLIIAGINLVGNIVLLVPIGFLVPFVYQNITWKKTLALATATGLAIETMQVVLKVGIFDIDDVILNALGFMIGYFVFVILDKWVRAKNYKNIIIAAVVSVVAAAAFYGLVVYPISHQPVINPRGGAGGMQSERLDNEQEGEVPQGEDLCGGTGGVGEIVSVGNDSFTIERNDNQNLTVNLARQATIDTPAGPASVSDLKTGDRVTLVGGPNPDGSFTAEAVFVCNP
ncbi:hypothetical protein A2837_02460 [Candidatus Kaiserbacteria bacterium RIFCSPHIGHO2_01_FULL_46_22]|uniref:VanZ-like domain-containing protein n=1 Tax=Candidatus Kaiserbacteria bacterium RIFCSPHIGHO2_01_FULL_46_22 TaxID=1798475 RepID=A0A1F6BWM8_9BACT|nr:MAG: hypothetical protein A2837_02460 [Candidatus Kaiserbacteria bacterium RIFCSPHIGHO2_01_FULL_46_22]